MCQAALSWDWLILDFSYVLILITGALVLKARKAEPPIWILFGLLSVLVGAFVFAVTYNMHESLQAMSGEVATLSAGTCVGF